MIHINFSSINEVKKHFIDYHCDLIIQPFVEEVLSNGELSFIFFMNEYSHSIIKKHKIDESQDCTTTITSFEPLLWMIEETKRILNKTNQLCLFSRVDVVLKGNELLLMEIEMIEPYLYFERCKDSEKKLGKKNFTIDSKK